MNPNTVIEQAKSTGSIWLGGEMEFPITMRMRQAQHHLSNIAEQIGGAVEALGMSALRVHCPYDHGYWLLDWITPESPMIQKIEHWECTSCYFDEVPSQPCTDIEGTMNAIILAKGGGA